MKKTFLLGNSPTFGLPFTQKNPPLIQEIKVKAGMLFKEAAADRLWEERGTHLYLTPSEFPCGVTLLETLLWLHQEAPEEALLFFPLVALHPSQLPKGGPWIPVVSKGLPPLFLYYHLLDVKPFIQGIAIEGEGLSEKDVRLILDPFTEEKGSISYLSLSLKGDNYLSDLRKLL